MPMSAEQLAVFRDALAKARQDLEVAEEEKTRLCNEELELNRELWRLRRLIDALEIQLGEATEEEVFKRNKPGLSAGKRR
jgi:hypothetical protein